MFNLDSIDDCISNVSEYKLLIEKFKSSIVYKDNSHFVRLPWYEEKLKKVPSKYDIGLAILDRVFKDLESKDLLNDQVKVFKEHEESGIIEKFHVDPSKYNESLWISHRPIIRHESQITTKIRPLFNCTLKKKTL